MLVITGPNMGGKSTYMRQAALIAILAHIGSFVPAAQATIGPLDRIFTRIGAGDDLAGGRSTFMVEMSETANILHNASERSLILMDEIGRGTSTFDGLSLAWATARHIAMRVRAFTLFATHYFELTALAERIRRRGECPSGCHRASRRHRVPACGAARTCESQLWSRCRAAGRRAARGDRRRRGATSAELESQARGMQAAPRARRGSCRSTGRWKPARAADEADGARGATRRLARRCRS